MDTDNSLGDVCMNIVKLIPWEFAVFIFFAYLFFNTTIFTERILSTWSGAISDGNPTEKGILIQATLLTIVFMIFTCLVNSELI